MTLAMNEDATLTISGLSFTDIDAGANSVTVTLAVAGGALAAASASGVTVGGTADAVTLTGTVSAINAFIANGELAYTAGFNSGDDVTMGITLDGSAPTTSSVTIDVAPVADAPAIAVVSPAIVPTPQAAAFVVNTTHGGYQNLPKIAPSGNGFVVAWQSSDSASTSTFGQLFDTHGQQIGGEYPVTEANPLFRHFGRHARRRRSCGDPDRGTRA